MTWTEEKTILRRLQILNMVCNLSLHTLEVFSNPPLVLQQEASMRKASDPGAKIGHNNPGFIHSSNEQVNKIPLAAIQTLQRPPRQYNISIY
jgi:hypothetical protein